MSSVLLTLLITFLYVILFIFLNNSSLIYSTLVTDFPIAVKANIIFSLIMGIGSSMSGLNLATLFLIALLTGINSVLILKNISKLRSSGSMKVTVGGSSLLGLASSGCASCGLPILAFLGLGSSVSMLPLKGYEFSLIVIAVLLVSTYTLVKQVRKKPQCSME